MIRIEELKNARTCVVSTKYVMEHLPTDTLQAADTQELNTVITALGALKTYLDTTISSLEA